MRTTRSPHVHARSPAGPAAPTSSILVTAALLVLVGALSPRPLAGQADLGFAVSAGVGAYDLSGDGTEAVVGGGLEVGLGSVLLIEPALRYFRYESQFDEDIAFLLPEVSVQARLPLRAVEPYLGVGVGSAIVVEGDDDGEATLHAAAGARVPVADRWTLRPELRLRSVDPWTGTIGDFTLGIVYRP